MFRTTNAKKWKALDELSTIRKKLRLSNTKSTQTPSEWNRNAETEDVEHMDCSDISIGLGTTEHAGSWVWGFDDMDNQFVEMSIDEDARPRKRRRLSCAACDPIEARL